MKPDLSVVPTKPLDPPYPPETTANGWKPEIDLQRLYSSDSWTLAEDDERPWMLRILVESWQSVPAGSMPADLRLFSRRIGCTKQFLEAHREALLSGWIQHSDGNLYHGFIVSQVEKMLDTRRKGREKLRAWREKREAEERASNQSVTGYKPVSNPPEQEQEQEQEQEEDQEKLANASRQNRGAVSTIPKAESVPFAKIQELWKELCPHLPQPILLTDARKAHIRARWNAELPDLDSWRECFEQVRDSDFLSGRIPPNGSRQKPFRATLDWVSKLDNTVKIYEGKYRNERKTR